MISKQKCLFYFVGDKPYKDLKEAQKADLVALMLATGNEPLGPGTDQARNEVADWLLAHAAAVVDTLTTTPTSRLKARKSHGGTKKKRQKLEPANLAA